MEMLWKHISESQTTVHQKIRIIKMPTDKGQYVCVGNVPQNDGCNPKGFQMNHTLLHMFNYHLPAPEVESHNGVNIMRLSSVCICAPITTSSNIHLLLLPCYNANGRKTSRKMHFLRSQPPDVTL